MPRPATRSTPFQLVAVFILTNLCCSPQLALGCERVHFGPKESDNIACKCSASYCDDQLDFAWPQDDSSLVKLVSDKNGARFELSQPDLASLLANNEQATAAGAGSGGIERIVSVDINKRAQQVVGYGGALTDSASMLIERQLDDKTRQSLVQGYFGANGLNYNLARIPIGGTDMSWRPYSYDDLPSPASGRCKQATDFELSEFRLQDEDLKYKLPLIRRANALRRQALGTGSCAQAEPDDNVDEHDEHRDDDAALRLLASSWSAPNWMKSNHNLVQGRIKDSLDGEYYDAYARYLIKFMEAYEHELNKVDHEDRTQSYNCTNRRGQVKIWALTPQNEPCTPSRLGQKVVNYNSVNFAPKQMGQFIRLNLVPNLLRVNRTARQLALFIWDDTVQGLDSYKGYLFPTGTAPTTSQVDDSDDEDTDGDDQQILKRKQLISGYNQFDRRTIDDYVRGLAIHWYSQGLDKIPYKSLYDLRRWLPNKYSMISTEASFIGRPQPGNWTRAEMYARDIIENFRAGTIGWIDWNLALNMVGGPTWSGNFLDAAILIDDRSHSPVFYKNPMFYAIGHLSRFVRAKSYIISSQLFVDDPSQQEHANGTICVEQTNWRRVDELGEQKSDLLLVASELSSNDSRALASGTNSNQRPGLWRRIALVLLNRSAERMKIQLNLQGCKSRLGLQPLNIELNAKSITSYAFNC